jgi:uncharacterized protein with von Willebrand factor type A (vWA) domain
VEARLVEFARLLRASGVRASPAEVTEAARAAALVGVGERAAFRAALRATLVKKAPDVPIFEQLFDLYFSALGRALEAVDRALLEEIERSRLLEGDDLEAAREAISEALPRLSPLARAALRGDRGTLARLFQAAALQLDFSGLVMAAQVSFYARRLLSAAGGGTLAHDRADLDVALRTAGLTPRGLDLVTSRVADALEAIEEAARRWVELEARARGIGRRRAGTPLAATPISQADRERVETAVRRLAQRIKARLQRRERSRRRGSLNVRRTLRKNMGLGGLPATLVFRRRQRERPDVVVLCDVSDSVRNVSRLMLLFLYTLQEIFHRVRSFVFVSEVGEVTQVFRGERDAARAADLATAGRVVSLAGNSNYGRALKQFFERHMGAVGRRTTVILIGDGRTNYFPPQAWVLRELRRKARRVLWICSEERWAWGSGDSEMPAYAREVDRVATVTTLADLEAVADHLVPREARGS